MFKKRVLQFIVFWAVILTPSLPVFAGQACTLKERTFVSDESVSIVGGKHAVSTYAESPLWTKSIPGTWIWNTFLVTNPNQTETVNFLLQTDLPGVIASSTLEIAADDYYRVLVNGREIASEFGENNFLTDNIHVYNPTEFLKAGENILVFEVTNAAYFYPGEGTVSNNPAGLLFRFTVLYNECVISPDLTNGGGGAVPLSYITQEKDEQQGIDVPNANGTFLESTPAASTQSVQKSTFVPSGSVSRTANLVAGNKDNFARSGEKISTSTDTVPEDGIVINEKKNQLSSAFFSLAFLDEIDCILFALTLLLLIWGVYQVFIKKVSMGSNSDPVRLYRKGIIFFALSSIGIIVLLSIFGFSCVVIPFTSIATVSLLLLISFKKTVKN